MKTLLTIVAVALAVPALAAAAEKKGERVEGTKPNLPDFKLDTGSTGTGASSAAAADPGKPAKKELDVSKMPFDGESVRTVVKFHMPEIQECYEKVLKDTGGKFEGRVVVGFIVDTNGVVSDARVLPKKSTLKDDRVHDCVLQMRSWYFPKPNDNRDHPIEYPFELKVQQ